MSALILAISGSLHRVSATQPPSGNPPTLVQGAAMARSKTVQLSAPPTVGNTLVLIAGLTHTSTTRTPTGAGWTQAGQVINATNSGATIWTRPVVAGDDGSAGITTTEAVDYTNVALLEVSGASGVVSGLVGSAAVTANLTIPAGKSNALPVAVSSSFQNNGNTSLLATVSSGWSIAAQPPLANQQTAKSIECFVRSALSDGSAIAVTVDGTPPNPRTDTYTACAFLLEAA